ncbi:MAG: methionine adenosyltransferase, partial [Nanoarchaeota archaeon]
MTKKYFVTSESVTEGHPDKICDNISDAILDNLIAQDPMSRVAIETLVTTGSVHVAGEVTTRGFADVQAIARRVLREIGYCDPSFGIDCEDAGVWVSIHGQSPDISQGVSEKEDKEQGAGDQGMMYGFACNETPELMPLPIILAHKLTRRMAEVRKQGLIRDIGPDGKSQVTVEYENDKPLRIEAVVIAQQHKNDISEEELRKEIMEKVVKHVCGYMMDQNTKVHINATGRFVIGGPEGDTGVTGRKIIVDSYGGVGRHGGGAFSGKDPSKVDRSAAYMARYIAKNIVAAGLADKCEIQLSYAIGVARPTSVNVDCFGTNKIPEEKIIQLIEKNFDM